VSEKDDEQSILFLGLVNWDLQRAITVMLENGNRLPVAISKVQTPVTPPRLRTTIQIQLETGAGSTEEFFYDDTLWTVYERVAPKYAQEFGGRGFNLRNPYTREVFNDARFNLTLQQIGVVPNGTLQAVRP